MNHFGENAGPTSHRPRYLLELVVVVVLTATLLAIMSAPDAINAGVAPKLHVDVDGPVGFATLTQAIRWFLRRCYRIDMTVCT